MNASPPAAHSTRVLQQRYEAAHRLGLAVVRGDDREYGRALSEVRRVETVWPGDGWVDLRLAGSASDNGC